jgi:hypothetical protein
MIEYLIQIGVDKNSRNKKGETAYHIASFREFPETAQKLKDLGVDSSAPQFPELKELYMGQRPPGKIPEMFLPGIVSGHYDAHSTIVFSPDGTEACWTEMYPPRGKGYGTSGVMMMKTENGRWTYPEKSTVMDGEPFFSPDGSYLLFSAPKQAGGRNIDLYVSFQQKDGTWTDRIHLGDDINASMHDISAFVSPDEKYLFFTSVGQNRPWGIYWVDAEVIEESKPDK